LVAKLPFTGIQVDVAGFRYEMFIDLPAKPMPLSVIAPEGVPEVGETVSVGGTKE
jgi:hypothetical protein